MAKLRLTIMSVHCQNTIFRKRSTSLNMRLAVRTLVCERKVDIVAGDLSGTSWRRKSGPQQQLDSTLEETIKNAKLLVHPGPYNCGGLGEVV